MPVILDQLEMQVSYEASGSYSEIEEAAGLNQSGGATEPKANEYSVVELVGHRTVTGDFSGSIGTRRFPVRVVAVVGHIFGGGSGSTPPVVNDVGDLFENDKTYKVTIEEV